MSFKSTIVGFGVYKRREDSCIPKVYRLDQNFYLVQFSKDPQTHCGGYEEGGWGSFQRTGTYPSRTLMC